MDRCVLLLIPTYFFPSWYLNFKYGHFGKSYIRCIRHTTNILSSKPHSYVAGLASSAAACAERDLSLIVNGSGNLTKKRQNQL